MKRNVMALCDLETAYAINFIEYVNKHSRNVPFEVHAFTTVEQLRIFLKGHAVELLLISESAMCAEVSDMPIGKIVILSEGIHRPNFTMYPAVNKYQSSASLIREVLSCYASEEKEHAEGTILKEGTKIIGIYSPVGRCLKTSLALTVGQLLGKERPALYIGFEPCAGFENLFHMKYERDLSDLLYYIRQDPANLTDKLNAMVQTVGTLDYLPPVRSAQDILNTTIEEWMQLIQLLREKSNYEVLVLDLDTCMNGLTEMLEICDIIYMPVKNDVMAEAKLLQFSHFLRMKDAVGIEEKIRKIMLPARPLDHHDRYAEQLIYGPLGEFAEGLLKNGEPPEDSHGR